MEPVNQPVPKEAIDAYNLFIHGHIDRRSFLDRVKKVAVSSAAAAAIVCHITKRSLFRPDGSIR